MGVCPTNNPHRQTLTATDRQGQVATVEFLVGDLPPGRGIVTALAGVHDHVTEVLVVLIASRQDDGVGPGCAGARNACLKGAVHTCLCKCCSATEICTNEHTSHFAELAFTTGTHAPHAFPVDIHCPSDSRDPIDSRRLYREQTYVPT
jgi:hypothetical protein